MNPLLTGATLHDLRLLKQAVKSIRNNVESTLINGIMISANILFISSFIVFYTRKVVSISSSNYCLLNMSQHINIRLPKLIAFDLGSKFYL